MRTYETTHPWIKFEIDLRRAPPKLWLLLGECQSKCEHVAGVPLRPNTTSELHKLYLAKGALATTAIEGNTLSEEQVLRHLDSELELPPSRMYLAQEIDNIVDACNEILEKLSAGEILELSIESIKRQNKLVLRSLKVDPDVVPGETRRYEVGAGRYKGAPAKDCDFLLGRLIEWLNSPDFAAPLGMETLYAIIRAVVAHLYIAWIHPFGDGNGRTARLVEFEILTQSGVPAPATHLLSNHYNQTRTEYYRQLDQASKSGGDIIPFLLYAVEGFRDGLRAQLQVIRDQQWDITWRNYVHERFGGRTSASDIRKRHLVLDLSRQLEPVEIERLTEVSPRVAAAYAQKTRKTLSRDINALMQMELVVRDEDGRVRANKGLILAFLPPRAPNNKR